MLIVGPVTFSSSVDLAARSTARLSNWLANAPEEALECVLRPSRTVEHRYPCATISIALGSRMQAVLVSLDVAHACVACDVLNVLPNHTLPGSVTMTGPTPTVKSRFL